MEAHFVHTKSRKVYFRSVQACNNRVKYETTSLLKQVNTKYKDRDLPITDYHDDNEFEPLRDISAPAKLQTCFVNEHIMDIKRSIQTIKE